MKIETVEATVTTNVPKDNVKAMTINAGGMEHIMKLLTNLYKDPQLAVIREYYTNGADAHKAAGVNVPVEIKLPTWDDPVYTVQDFGIGMSEWDITNVYSEYGASTKRDTNEQVGAFGLGCKSAFTIANQFTIVSVKDGRKVTALFSKVLNGTYESTIVSNVETTQGNGTLVKIPVSSNLEYFRRTALQFFSFSEPGSVLVDGKQPIYALANADKILDPNDPDFLMYVEPKSTGDSYIIMGSVPYVLTSNEVESSMQRLGFATHSSAGFLRMPKYIPAPIGSVDLTPAREGLMFTEKTKALVDKYISFLLKDLIGIAKGKMDECENLQDFFDVHRYWNNIVPVPLEWKGESVPREVYSEEYMREIHRTSWGGSTHTETKYLRLDTKANFIVVSGIPADKYKRVNGYLTPYMTAENIKNAYFLITDEKDFLDNKWLKLSPSFTFVSADDIIEKGKAQRKKERGTTPRKSRGKMKYPVLDVAERQVTWIEYPDIPEGTPYVQSKELTGPKALALVKDVYYFHFEEDIEVSDSVADMFEVLTDYNEIIILNNTRGVDTLEKRVSGVFSLADESDRLLTEGEALITDDMRQYSAVARSNWKVFLENTGIDARINEVKDEKLVAIIKPPQRIIDVYRKYELIHDTLRYFDYVGKKNLRHSEYLPYDRAGIDALDKKYPLIGAISTWSVDPVGAEHIIKYLNLIHEETV